MQAFIGYFLFGIFVMVLIIYILMYLLDKVPDMDQDNP